MRVSVVVFICVLINAMRQVDKPAKHSLCHAWPVTAWLGYRRWDDSDRCILRAWQWTSTGKTSVCDLLGWSHLTISETLLFLSLMWRKLIPDPFKVASYVGQVIFGFQFLFFLNAEWFCDSLAAVFLFPFVKRATELNVPFVSLESPSF